VPIERLKAEHFRCLTDLDIEFESAFNLVLGPNASGKTSILEAIAYLARARSFRGAPVSSLVQHGSREFVLYGTGRSSGRVRRLGVRNGPEGLEVRVDGAGGAGAAELAEALPLQVIDPDVHELVAGGPDQRRRYVDGVAFHVEHGFIGDWRRYRRVLRQRNAALKCGGGEIGTWSRELVEAGEALDSARRSVLDVCRPVLEDQAAGLLGGEIRFEYRPGWSQGTCLADALDDALDRDRQVGSTQVGPHRADLRLVYDERQARRLVSRGQQKLLACSMVLAATEVIQTALGEPLLLLLDDPAAELDEDSLGRLVDHVTALGCQVVATALTRSGLTFPGPTRLFHVEHGDVRPAG